MIKTTSEHKKLYSFEDQELRVSDLWNPTDSNPNFVLHPKIAATENNCLKNSNVSNSESNLNFKNNFNENILNLSSDPKNNLPYENNNLNFASSPKNISDNSLTFGSNPKNNENILSFKSNNENSMNFCSSTRNYSNNEIFLNFKNNPNTNNLNENSLNFGHNQKNLNLPPSPIQPNRSMDMDSEFLKEYEDAITDRDKKISELLNEISLLRNEPPDVDEGKKKWKLNERKNK